MTSLSKNPANSLESFVRGPPVDSGPADNRPLKEGDQYMYIYEYMSSMNETQHI
jgi:hypothetical protein